MRGRLAVLALVCVCVLGVAGSSLNKHQRELKEHYDHLALIAEFKCADPQRRAVSIHKLLSEPETRGKAFFPDVTVLGRCDCHAGTCVDGHRCAPAHREPVMLPVKVTFLHDTVGHKKGSWQIEYYQFDNHTACSCVQSTPEEAKQCGGDLEPELAPVPPTTSELKTVRVVHEHYVVPSSEWQQYHEVLASLPAIEGSYQAQDTTGPTRLCIPPACE